MSSFSLYATNFIQAGAIYPYVNTMSVYHCSADHNVYKFGPNSISPPPQLFHELLFVSHN